jgi:hypothetical protein
MQNACSVIMQDGLGSGDFVNQVTGSRNILREITQPFYLDTRVYETGIRGVRPVIQATGSSEFEDDLGSGDFVSGYSYHMSVRTGLPDHTMQTKFQSQLSSNVETPVPSI